MIELTRVRGDHVCSLGDSRVLAKFRHDLSSRIAVFRAAGSSAYVKTRLLVPA
jgi:hypothetical protein